MERQQFRHLFTPFKIGTVTVPNRTVFSAHATLYFEMGKNKQSSFKRKAVQL